MDDLLDALKTWANYFSFSSVGDLRYTIGGCRIKDGPDLSFDDLQARGLVFTLDGLSHPSDLANVETYGWFEPERRWKFLTLHHWGHAAARPLPVNRRIIWVGSYDGGAGDRMQAAAAVRAVREGGKFIRKVDPFK
jgi:hypothetical protein